MDRKGNDFLFSGVKSTNNQQKMMQKIQQEKEALKFQREQGDKALLVQIYLRGYSSRIGIYRRLEAELLKNLSDLEKLGQLLFQSKGQTFYLPIPKLVVLMRNFHLMTQLLKKKPIPSINPNPSSVAVYTTKPGQAIPEDPILTIV
jgi:hypothetical protein